MQHRLISFIPVPNALGRAGNAPPKGDNEPTLYGDHHKANPVWLCKIKALKNCQSPTSKPDQQTLSASLCSMAWRAKIHPNQLCYTSRLRASNDDRFPDNSSANDIPQDPPWIVGCCRHRDAAADAGGRGATFGEDVGLGMQECRL